MQWAARTARFRRRDWHATLASLGLLLGCVGFLLALASKDFEVVALATIASIACCMPALGVARAGKLRREVTVAVEGGQLVVGTRSHPATRVWGALAAEPHLAVVMLDDGSSYELSFERPEAPALVRAVGGDVQEVPLRWPLHRSLGRLWPGLVGFGTLSLFVGADGIQIRSALRRTYLSYADTISIELTEGDHRIVFHRRWGGLVSFSLAGRSPREHRALVARLRENAAYPKHDDSAELVALDRGSRAFEDWREETRDLLGRVGSFREHVLTEDVVAAQLHDVRASAARRIGAAIALQRVAPERVRLAAETCAEPELRVALEAVCDDTLEARHLRR